MKKRRIANMKTLWMAGFLVAVISTMFTMAGCSKKTDNSVTNPNPGTFKPTGTIQGVVRDRVTLEPIAGAVVSIGVQTATSDQRGQYVLSNVPATSDALNSSITDKYRMTVDLRSVTSPVKMKDAATTIKYPDFAYHDVELKYTSLNDSDPTSGCYPYSYNYNSDSSDTNQEGTANCTGQNSTNHDTPVQGNVASVTTEVGKLDANIVGVVAVGCNEQESGFFDPVPDGYIVKLYNNYACDSDECTSAIVDETEGNSSSGQSGHLINQTETSKGTGYFTFTNVEAGSSVSICSSSPDGTRDDCKSYTAPADNETLTLSIAQSTAIHLCSNDAHGPTITQVSPEPGSDLAAGSIDVNITFSEPVKQTLKNDTDPKGDSKSNLYSIIEVMYDGSKTGNVAYSLNWNSSRDMLTVTIPDTGKSSRYHVRLKDVDQDGLFEDANGKTGNIGICPDDSTVPTDYGVIVGDIINNDCTVYFTTNGGAIPKPVDTVSVVNASSIDNKGTDAVLDWPTSSGSKYYNVYCRNVQVFADDSRQNHQFVLLNPGGGDVEDIVDVNGSSATVYLDPGDLVEAGSIAIEKECKIRGVGADGDEGLDASPVAIAVIADAVGPELEPGDELSCGAGSDATVCDSNDEITHINLTFDEQLNDALAQTEGNYEISVASGTAPLVTEAIYNAAELSVRLTLATPLSPSDLNPSTIEPGLNGMIDTALVGDDVLVRPSCVTAGADGFLDTLSSGDDTYSGNEITVGSNGVCQSTAAGDDVQELPVNQGTPNAVCIMPGGNGVLNTKVTPTGDDAVSGSNILAGPNGICDAPVITPGADGYFDTWLIFGDDVAIRPSCVGPGPNKFLDTAPVNDDEIVVNAAAGNSINVGQNGVCDTTATGDDTQASIGFGNGTPNVTCITAGTNGVLNTTVLGGDDSVSGSTIISGTNGYCETVVIGDDVPVIPFLSSRNGTFITAGPDNYPDTIFAWGPAAADDVVIGYTPYTSVDDVQVTYYGYGLGATSILAGDNVVLNSLPFLAGDDVVVGGLAVTVTNVTDVAGNPIKPGADEYNTDGSVE